MKKIDENCLSVRSVHCNDSTELAEQLTVKKKSIIIAQRNIVPTFLHKFYQFLSIYLKVVLRQYLRVT